MCRAILLRVFAPASFMPVWFMVMAIQRQFGSYIGDQYYVTLPQPAQTLMPALVPFIIALGCISVCSFFISVWIEWREERAGRWPIQRQQATEADSHTNRLG
jgi:hypothetical protein